ncbi:MAG: nitrile hydratase subunit beta [Rubrivivax sp.]|nr:nitrile hydratase subunit beta [Rubrivivax sp.]
MTNHPPEPPISGQPPAGWYLTHADLGGTAVAEPIDRSDEAEAFHAPWERQAFALTLAMGACGLWNIDMSRAAREQLPAYARLGYYGIWLEALLQLLQDAGLLTAQELARGEPQEPPRQGVQALKAGAVAAVLRRGSPSERPAAAPARFAVGDSVRTRASAAAHHTRLPAYARGRRGRIVQVHGVHAFADARAQGQGDDPQWLYRVSFEARELWGSDTTATAVSLDLWEPYLQAAAPTVPGSA